VLRLIAQSDVLGHVDVHVSWQVEQVESSVQDEQSQMFSASCSTCVIV